MPAHQPTVAIIDDDDSIRRALRRLIRSYGHNVETFATAEEFLEAFLATGSQNGAQTKETGCLVLDVHLPGISGLELQKRLTAQGREVPIVFITAYPDEPARQQALQGGAIAFLHKPFGDQPLLEAVEKALGKGQ